MRLSAEQSQRAETHLRRIRWLVGIMVAAAALSLWLWSVCTPEMWPACVASPYPMAALLLYGAVALVLLVCCCHALSVSRPTTFYEMAPWIEASMRRKHARANPEP